MSVQPVRVAKALEAIDEIAESLVEACMIAAKSMCPEGASNQSLDMQYLNVAFQAAEKFITLAHGVLMDSVEEREMNQHMAFAPLFEIETRTPSLMLRKPLSELYGG